MASQIKGRSMRKLLLGEQVLRATAVLPASATTTPYFTVTGGRVMITSLIGEFTTAMDATATTLKFSAVPTVGTANNMCAVSAALTSAEIGALLSLDGVIATALQVGVANSGSVGGMTKPQIVAAGTIDAVTATATAPGSAKWALTYIPIDEGAYVTAA
ncbi:MAG TPA: hypothetical protein VJB57_19350 [Dehalococcoidia bacterium]|nr:hypothetical protein [Dehalococcoidia bacterium]